MKEKTGQLQVKLQQDFQEAINQLSQVRMLLLYTVDVGAIYRPLMMTHEDAATMYWMGTT